MNWTSEQCRGWRARQIYSTWRVVICRLLDRSQEIIIQPNWLDYRLLDVRLILLLQDQAIVGYTKIFLLLFLEYALLFNNCFCLNMVEDCVSVESRTTNEVGNKVYERISDSKQMKPSGSKKEGKCGEEPRLLPRAGFVAMKKCAVARELLCRGSRGNRVVFQNIWKVFQKVFQNIPSHWRNETFYHQWVLQPWKSARLHVNSNALGRDGGRICAIFPNTQFKLSTEDKTGWKSQHKLQRRNRPHMTSEPWWWCTLARPHLVGSCSFMKLAETW